MTVPVQKPGRSKQDYQTPPEFLTAVKKRLKIDQFDIDLAASESNKVATMFYDETMNSLADYNRWKVGSGWAWLNPPYSNIRQWVEKASREKANVAMLVPASPGSNWWVECVEPHAYISFLVGRLTFVGEGSPYPKDSALLLFSPWGFVGHEYWRWKEELKEDDSKTNN